MDDSKKTVNKIEWREAATGGLYLGIVYAALSIATLYLQNNQQIVSIISAISFFSVAGFLFAYATRMARQYGNRGYTYLQSMRFILKMSMFAGVIAGIGLFLIGAEYITGKISECMKYYPQIKAEAGNLVGQCCQGVEKFTGIPAAESKAYIFREVKEFRQYLLVGGMPQVVTTYIAENSFQAADREKRDILELYRDDVAKHAGANARKVRAIFDRIPSSLTHKEKKFNLSSLGKNTKLRTYEDAFFWLDDAMITNMCYNAEEPVAGLNLNLDDSKVKCYMMDTGLLVTHALNTNAVTEDLYKAVLMDRLGINEGMIAENYTAQALATNGHKLFFYSKARAGETRSNELEIDFLIMNGRKTVPIEVKSSQSVHHSSLTKFMGLYSKHIGTPIILCRRDLEVKDGIIYMPIYMASLL